MGQLLGGSVIVSDQKTADIQRRTEAVKDQLIRKGLLAQEDVQHFLDLAEEWKPENGASVVAEPGLIQHFVSDCWKTRQRPAPRWVMPVFRASTLWRWRIRQTSTTWSSVPSVPVRLGRCSVCRRIGTKAQNIGRGWFASQGECSAKWG